MSFPVTIVIGYAILAAFGMPWHYAAFCAVQSLLGYAAGRFAQKAAQ